MATQQQQQQQQQQIKNAADDSSETLVSISCLDFLLIELVPMAERMARAYEESLDYPSLANKTIRATTITGPSSLPSMTGEKQTPITQDQAGKLASGPGPTTAATTTVAGSSITGPATTLPLTYDGLPETEVFKDSVYFRLETLGFRVGQGLCERFSRDRPRFTEHLDAIKFLCKDLWGVVFRKQIDNLKTNHRGVYVLTDSKFRPFTRMSMANNTEAVLRAAPHLYFPCGIIRGVLSSLGIKATVQAETSELPVAIFQIKTASGRS